MMHNMSYEGISGTTATEATATTAHTTEDKFGVTFFFTVMRCCLSLAIFLVNGVPLYILKCYVKYINAVHLTIAYLTLADICLGVAAWFKLVSIFLENLNGWEGVCVFASWSNGLSQHWKIQAITLIAVERYFLVARSNFHQKHVTPAKLKYVFAAGVTIIVVMTTVSIFTGNITFNPGCIGIAPGKRNSIRLLSSSMYWMYALVLIFCYVKIIIFIWKRNGPTDRHTKKEKKTTILTMIIVSLFLATTAPRVVFVISLPDKPTKGQTHFGAALTFLLFCNSIINPLIYTCKVPAFKEAYGKILGRICKNTSRNRVGIQYKVQEYRSNMNINIEPRRDVDLVHHM